MADSIAPHWREALALDRRSAPEFYTSAVEVGPGPHSEEIRFTLVDLGLAAVFCIEGVPTVGFLNEPDVSLARIDELHRILWNQGLMSLLIVLKEDELAAYSLVQRPFRREEGQRNDPRLITTLSLLSDAIALRELIDSTESGRFWFENDEFFNPDDRVDSVLLSNLLEAFRAMRDDLGREAAQALLMQTMFIAYLEDRKIIGEEVFQDASNKSCSSLAEMLGADTPSHFEALFVWLKDAFNGNLFNAPCAFEGEAPPPKLAVQHLQTLAQFRHGREEMASGQLHLWGYDFRYMPIGLISAVYDRFLKEEVEKKRTDGVFYTPMFLADVVVNQLWDDLTDTQRVSGKFCDPACGSGIFLVRLFQRLVAHHCRVKKKSRATWGELKAIAHRLYGMDINSSAVRVATFSLYIALLEQAHPPDLPALIKAGKLLPPLYGDTLLPAYDFFSAKDQPKYDAVIGNPPWKGRRGQVTPAQTWANAHRYPYPARDIAWGFIWKALKVVKPGGVIAFLLPAMGVLHNTSRKALLARQRLLKESRVKRIINLSDLCFQLFDGAQRPTAFVLYAPSGDDLRPYRFEYWVPKADLNLRLKRLMTLSRADRIRFRSDSVVEDPTLFKRRLWTRAPEEKLLQYLKTISPLNTFIHEYNKFRARTSIDRAKDWVIGQGFKPAQDDRLDDPNYETTKSKDVTRYPYLYADTFQTIVLPTIETDSWSTSVVQSAGFAEGFIGPHILIPQGVVRSIGRVRAAYCEQSVAFEHSLQSIAFPEKERCTAKVLTAVLNSSLAAWVYFYDTANFGADRAKVHHGELLKLPFDVHEKMPDPARAAGAGEKIVQLIDREVANADELRSSQSTLFDEIDQLVYDYYGLGAQDIVLIEDTFRYIIPAMQPRRRAGLQKIWRNSQFEHRSDYASMLCEALEPCFRQRVSASLAAKSRDIGVLKLTLGAEAGKYQEKTSSELGPLLQDIRDNLPVPLPGNIQLVPDLHCVIGADMYLVKPMQLWHWLKSTALADAENIAAEFSAAVARDNQSDNARAGW